jgi:hypothetical protein
MRQCSSRPPSPIPIYNHYYPDTNNLINTPDSAGRLAQEGPLLPVTVSLPATLVSFLEARSLPVPSPVSGYALVDTARQSAWWMRR